MSTEKRRRRHSVTAHLNSGTQVVVDGVMVDGVWIFDCPDARATALSFGARLVFRARARVRLCHSLTRVCF